MIQSVRMRDLTPSKMLISKIRHDSNLRMRDFENLTSYFNVFPTKIKFPTDFRQISDRFPSDF